MDYSTRMFKSYSDYMSLLGALKTERSSWDSLYREVSENLFVRGARMQRTERNRGDRKTDYNRILDPYATRARRILTAGLVAGMSSPARPWHKLAIDDEDLMEYQPVKEWLELVTVQQRNIFARSNTYRALAQMYDSIGAFGTSPIVIKEDYEDVVSCHPVPTGEFYIATDDKGNVTLLMREFEMTVGQMFLEFGENNCSHTVRNLYQNGKGIHSWVPVVQVIQPRHWSDRQGQIGGAGMEWASCYFELSQENEDKMLAHRGYRRFPVVCARWDVMGGDVYGTSPGMEVLGHVERLQHHQLRKSQAIDYMVKPPLQVPASMKDNPVRTLPGGVNYVDMAGPGQTIKSAWDVNLRLDAMLLDVQDLRKIIDQTFYTDLFLMISMDDRSNVTAHEIAARNEEKLLMLGPVLERLHGECLRGLIEATFARQMEAGMLPPPPEELQGKEVNVEFVSMLAQAQRAIGTQSIDRLMTFVGTIAQVQAGAGMKPTVLHKVDMLEAVDAYATMLGTDPRLVIPDDVIEERLAAEEQAAQQAAAMEQMAAAASAAKDAAAAVPQEGSALQQAMGAVQGYTTEGVLP
jgi:hypothetical protein